MEIFAYFKFEGKNEPIIVTSYKQLWSMIKTYDLEFYKGSIDNFIVYGKKQVLSVKPLTQREKEKFILQDFAFEFKRAFMDATVSYGVLFTWQGFFEKYGKKYGCLREFKENCLI